MNIWSWPAGGINLQDGSKGSHLLAFISLCGLFPQRSGMTFVTNKVIPNQWQTVTSKVRTSKKCWHVLFLHSWVERTTLEKLLPTNTNLLDIWVGYLGMFLSPATFSNDCGPSWHKKWYHLGTLWNPYKTKGVLPTMASWHWTSYLLRTRSQINLNSL